MANLSHELNVHEMSLLRSSTFPIQSVHTTDESRLSQCLESQKLLSEFGDCSEKMAGNFSLCNSYSVDVDDAHFMHGEMNWSTANFEHDFGGYLYSNDGHRISQEDHLEYLAFNQSSDHIASAIRTRDVDLRPLVESSCMETSSSYGSLCSEPEDVTHGGVEQFQLFSEVDGDQYCIESFGVQKTQTSCIKRPYTDVELIESPIAKKHCSNSSSPTKPKSKQSPSKDPQSIAAKHRREKISERLKILQDLVPNGTKVDLVTMLEKAINYAKFLQLQVKVLATDEFWPSQGGKAPDITRVREAIDAILSSHSRSNAETRNPDD